MAVEEIERTYTVNRFQGRLGAGDIRGFADLTRHLLRSAADLANIVLLGQGPDSDAIDLLLRQLEYGLPVAAIDLLRLPVRLTRGQYLALLSSGITTAEQTIAQPKERLSDILTLANVELLAGADVTVIQ